MNSDASWYQWMAWTWPVGIFFIGIAVLLATMTLLEVYKPTLSRRGWLPMPTTRGDRLFIGLLTAAFANLAWLGLTDSPAWIGAIVSSALLCLVMWKG